MGSSNNTSSVDYYYRTYCIYKEKKPMSRTVKGIIAGVAVLVLLGGSLLALKLTEPKPDTSS